MKANLFDSVYERGIQRTICFLMSRGVQADRAQEIAQSAWVQGWLHQDQLREECSVVSWINTIALNLFRRQLRTSNREVEFALSQPFERTTSINEAEIDVDRILSACREKDRKLLKAQLDGATPQDIADQEGTSAVAIRLRMLRARRNARELCTPRAPLLKVA